MNPLLLYQKILQNIMQKPGTMKINGIQHKILDSHSKVEKDTTERISNKVKVSIHFHCNFHYSASNKFSSTYLCFLTKADNESFKRNIDKGMLLLDKAGPMKVPSMGNFSQ